MKILVTGSTGLVGSEAVKFFSEQGHEVIGIDANMRHEFFNTPNKEGALKIDIRNKVDIDDLLEANDFGAIIHTAAQPSHDYSKEHVLEDFHINATGTLNLLESAREFCPDAVFVHCSTDKVYGWGMHRGPGSKTKKVWLGNTKDEGEPIKSHYKEVEEGLVELETRYHSDWLFDEQTPFEPPYSPFGVSKLASDAYVQEYAAQGWLTTGVFRMGCITGRAHEGAEQHGFLAYLAKCIKQQKIYKIYGYKGKQVRDQIHAHDLVTAFWAFIQNPKSGAFYNVGGGPDRSVSVLEAGKLIAEKTGKLFLYEMVDDERFGDRIWDIHDMSKFRNDYPEWEYEYSLDDIISDLCE